ncbi:protein kinase [Nonomuraea sp. NBC_01738]|uniref:WD40 repeat domain-containing serine/threonine protein kinase n=1 Tax=Nonomuraea sp. NBC_01738 TaxID=2976003 RepID=UPI002E0F331F|nr:protein kinase [Nonomuraea sp. NBC_01738]
MTTDPEHLGGYWIAGRLGSGGQGVVYEAYDDSGDRFALKVLHGSPGVREVEAARRVRSFCTARLIAADLDGPTPYLVSEYVAGPSLRVKVAESGPYAGDDLYRLATGIATALTAVHEAGVVHRDLKPDNVLIGTDGPRVIDFGLARHADMSLTTENVVAGTPTYLPPEVYKGLRAGEKGDVYAWGCVTVFAATGEDPFAADDLGAVMHRVLTTDAALDTLESPLRELVAEALDKDPERRPLAKDLLMRLLISAEDPLEEGKETARDLRHDLQEPSLGAIAERVYGRLSRAEQAVVPDVFLRLVGLDDDGVDTRRRARHDELVADLDPGRAEVAERVIEAYGDAGLLQWEAEGDKTVTMAHAALLRAWPRLHEWLDDEREGLRTQRTLAAAARSWQEAGQRDVDLLQGTSLDKALAWAAGGRTHVTLSRTERAFLDAATALGRRSVRRRRVVSVALAVLLVAALVATGVAVYQGEMTREALAETSARSLAGRAEQLRPTDPATARRLSAVAWRLAPVTEARSALMMSITDPVRDAFAEPDAAADSVYTFDAGGRWLAAVRGGQARIWDPGTRTLLMEIRGVGRSVVAAAMNPSGTVLAVATRREVRLFDTRTGAQMRVLAVQLDQNLRMLAFDGDVLSTVGKDLTGALWRLDGTQLMSRPLSRLRTDGRRVLSTSLETSTVRNPGRRPAEVWENGRPLDLPWLRAMEGSYTAAALGPNGTTVALSGGTGTRIFELATGKLLAGPWSTASYLAYSADGKALAEGGDGYVTVRQTGTWAELLTAGEDTGGPLAPALGPGRLRFMGEGGRLKTFALPANPHPVIGPPTAVRTLSHDGRLLAVADGKTITIWDATAYRQLAVLPVTTTLMAFTWDGKRLATSGAQATTVDLWDIATAAKAAVLTTSPVAGLAFSPDGNTLAVSSAGWVELHAGGRVRRVAGVQGAGLAWRPDGLMLAVYGEARVYTIDPVTASPVVPNASGRASGVVAYSPDGRIAATGNSLGHVTLWDSALRAPLAPPIALGSWVRALSFSRDGSTLAVATDEGLTTWDARTGGRLGGDVDLGMAENQTSSDWYGEPLYSLAPAAELVGVGPMGRVARVVTDPEKALRRVCAQDGEISPAAWAQYVPALSPRKVC